MTRWQRFCRRFTKRCGNRLSRRFRSNVNRVIVSPDGQLNFLSFATLLDPDKGFVAEKYSIEYVTSGRDLVREPQPTQSKQVIVMANPKFDRDIELAQVAKVIYPRRVPACFAVRKSATSRI